MKYGMPDELEVANGLNPNSANANGTHLSAGYTDLEWFNGTSCRPLDHRHDRRPRLCLVMSIAPGRPSRSIPTVETTDGVHHRRAGGQCDEMLDATGCGATDDHDAGPSAAIQPAIKYVFEATVTAASTDESMHPASRDHLRPRLPGCT